MTRVHVICEGQTEETFVNEVLAPHLARHQVYPAAALVGKPGHKGGHVTTARMAFDIKRRLLDDQQAWCTTFFDFYGLDPDFVGRKQAGTRQSHAEKAAVLEAALKQHVAAQTDDTAIRRFIPYVQMYEFEGLLFSDPVKMAAGLYQDDLAGELGAISASFATPEEINDSPHTAPSKRIRSLMPDYDKPLHGSLAALEVGLDIIRAACPRFDGWIDTLEKIGKE